MKRLVNLFALLALVAGLFGFGSMVSASASNTVLAVRGKVTFEILPENSPHAGGYVANFSNDGMQWPDPPEGGIGWIERPVLDITWGRTLFTASTEYLETSSTFLVLKYHPLYEWVHDPEVKGTFLGFWDHPELYRLQKK